MTEPTTTIELTAEDLARLHALAQFGGAICPGEPMRDWCREFYMRLLPLRLGVAPGSGAEDDTKGVVR